MSVSGCAGSENSGEAGVNDLPTACSSSSPAAAPLTAQTFTAKVIRITDGDVIKSPQPRGRARSPARHRLPGILPAFRQPGQAVHRRSGAAVSRFGCPVSSQDLEGGREAQGGPVRSGRAGVDKDKDPPVVAGARAVGAAPAATGSRAGPDARAAQGTSPKS